MPPPAVVYPERSSYWSPLMRSPSSRAAVALLAWSGLIAGLFAQDTPKTFDVASVKANQSGTTQANINFTAGGATFTNLPLRAIIQFAYGINQPSRLAGVPNWAESERFDIVAKGSVNSLEDRRVMLQALLMDRFKLATHTEQRSLPNYTLLLARPDGKLGESLKPSSVDCAAAARGGRGGAATTDGAAAIRCGVRPGGPGELHLTGVRMAAFASMLSISQGRPVADGTGLTGTFDIELSFAPDGPFAGRGGDGPPPTDRPSIFTALSEQLGLRLESQKGPVEILVISRAEKPAEN